MKYYSPLEQFEIIPLFPIKLGMVDISLTNSSLFMIFVALTIFFGGFLSTYESIITPRRIWQTLAENVYEFVLSMVRDNIGPRGGIYFPFIFCLFLFILTANLIGMIPYSFTVTSHLIVTFGLSLSIFIAVTLLGFHHHKLKFFSILLPSGTPLVIASFLVVIELVSYTAKAFSLAIRLFANMMSGHSLLKILAGFAWTMLSAGGVFYLLHIVPMGVVLAVTGLEFAIAALQAYVFTILTCTYLSESIHLSH